MGERASKINVLLWSVSLLFRSHSRVQQLSCGQPPGDGQACFAAGFDGLRLHCASGRRKHLALACVHGGAAAPGSSSAPAEDAHAPEQASKRLPAILPPSPPLRTPAHSDSQTPAQKRSQPPALPCPLTVGAGGKETLVAQPLRGAVGVELVLAGQAQDLGRVEEGQSTKQMVTGSAC